MIKEMDNMEILTNSMDGFYNFATVRISKLRSDIGSRYSDILSDWDELKQFVEEYCQNFADDITNFLNKIDDKTPANQRYAIDRKSTRLNSSHI